jgi:hypothetical protein
MLMIFTSQTLEKLSNFTDQTFEAAYNVTDFTNLLLEAASNVLIIPTKH